MALALALTAVIGFAGTSSAQGHRGYGYYDDMSPEQQKAMQEMRAEFDNKIRPLQQQFFAKQAELDALYYKGAPQDDPKVRSLIKEVNDLDAKLYAAYGDLRRQMNEKGLPCYGGGMRHGYGGMMRGPGHGWHGMGPGMTGRGMHHGRGGCCSW